MCIESVRFRMWVMISAVTVLLVSGWCRGDEPAASDRYGLFGLLDRRSSYGKYWFPEPLQTDESDVDNEIRADWFHAEKRGHQFDSVKVELEKSFGLLTVEIVPGYESDRSFSFDSSTGREQRQTEEGFSNIELGGRYPIFQYVSPNRFFDTTFVLGLEVAIPSGSKISKDIEFVPKLFNLTRIGEHFAIQSGVGDSILAGPEGHGLSTLEYSVVLGYELTKHDLPVPFVLSMWPLVEFEGEYTLNQEDAGHNALFGTVGMRFNFESIKWLPAQPRIGIGYTFPIDEGAREEFHWGIVTSLVFEY